MTNERALAPCRCGKVELEIVGAPILRGICYCASCQAAGRLYRAAPGVDSVLAEDGGTDYVLYRKDRVRCIKGARPFAGATAEAQFADEANARPLLWRAHVRRLHQGTLALGLSGPPA